MWSLMVGAALIGGLGAGAVDAGLNTFAATYYSTRAVNWLHACYGVGATAGPAIMTGLIMAQHPWQSGYGLVAASQLALALAFLVTRRRWSGSAGGGAPASVPALTLAATLRRPVVWLSMTVFFVYTGLEAAAGLWCFTLFTEGRGFPVEQAGTWVSLYWGSLTVGRITLGFVAPYVAETRLLRSSLLGLMAGSAVLWLDPEALHPALGLVLMGFSAAAVFPTLIAMTARRLGSGHRANAIGFQMASAVFGGALLPAGLGLLAGQAGLAVIAPALAAAAALLFVLHELLNAPTVPTPD
jgi:fucose permease